MHRMDEETKKLARALLADTGKRKTKLAGHCTVFIRKSKNSPDYRKLAHATREIMDLL